MYQEASICGTRLNE